MALTFIGERPTGIYCVRHLDGNPSNNTLANLSYGTYLENEHDKVEHGTFGMRMGGAKLSPTDIKKIRESTKSQIDLSIEYNVSRPTITRIINKTIWKGEIL